MVETDILQIRIRGDFRRNNASDIEVFTDGRQNDFDLAHVSLTWHMKGNIQSLLRHYPPLFTK